MANLSNINNKLIVTDGGNLLVNATANLTTYGGLTIDNISNPSIAMKTNSASGWIYNQYITNTGTNNFSMGVNQTIPYWGVKTGAGMDNPALAIISSGNVGIGTISPDFALDIEAVSSGVQLQMGRTTTSAGSTWMGSDSNGFHLGVGAYGSGNSVSDPNGFTVLTSGNVGIGTASPTSKLTVSGPSNAASNTPSQAIVDIVGSSTAHLLMGTASVSPYGAWINTDANGQPLVLMGTGGNVGIGTNSPSEILQTNKNSAGNIVGGYFTNSQANTGAESVSLAFGLNRSGGDFVRQVKAITFGAEQQWTGTPSTVDGYLAFSTVSDETVSERIRITSSGLTIFKSSFVAAGSYGGELNIGGSSVTTFGLQAKYNQGGATQSTLYSSPGYTSNDQLFLLGAGAGNTSQLVLRGNGRVGIDTTSPQSKLDLLQPDSSANTLGQSVTAALGIRMANAVGQVGQIVFNNDAAPSYGYGSIGMIMTSGTGVGLGDMIFSTKGTGSDSASTERMRIDSGGNVRVNFNQSGSAGNVYFQDIANGASMFYIQPAQYVGTAPYNTNYINAANSSNIGFIAGGTQRMRITSDGGIFVYPSTGSYGLSMNDTNQVMNSGYINGNQTVSLTYTCTTMSSMFIECVFNHYGYVTSYGCARVATFAVGPVITIQNILEVTSGNGGSWTFNRVSNTQFTVAKTAGTYAGGGRWYVKINGARVFAA